MTKIYKITFQNTDLVYIGQTKSTLKHRLACHKSHKSFSYIINQIELIEEVEDINADFTEFKFSLLYIDKLINKQLVHKNKTIIIQKLHKIVGTNLQILHKNLNSIAEELFYNKQKKQDYLAYLYKENNVYKISINKPNNYIEKGYNQELRKKLLYYCLYFPNDNSYYGNYKKSYINNLLNYYDKDFIYEQLIIYKDYYKVYQIVKDKKVLYVGYSKDFFKHFQPDKQLKLLNMFPTKKEAELYRNQLSNGIYNKRKFGKLTLQEKEKLKNTVGNKNNLGKTFSVTTKEKLSQSHSNQKPTELTIQKSIEAHKGKKQKSSSINQRSQTRKSIVICLETNITYNSIAELSRKTHISYSYIRKCVLNQSECFGYHYKLIPKIS